MTAKNWEPSALALAMTFWKESEAQVICFRLRNAAKKLPTDPPKIRGYILGIHPAGRSRRNQAAVVHHCVIEPEATGEIAAIITVSGEDAAGDVAAPVFSQCIHCAGSCSISLLEQGTVIGGVIIRQIRQRYFFAFFCP